MSVAFKYKLFHEFCNKDEVLLMYHNNGEGGGFMNLEGGLGETAHFLMEKQEPIKQFILDAACKYLKTHEVEKQDLIKELYNQDQNQ